jgi:hypothetical protein
VLASSTGEENVLQLMHAGVVSAPLVVVVLVVVLLLLMLMLMLLSVFVRYLV